MPWWPLLFSVVLFFQSKYAVVVWSDAIAIFTAKSANFQWWCCRLWDLIVWCSRTRGSNVDWLINCLVRLYIVFGLGVVCLLEHRRWLLGGETNSLAVEEEKSVRTFSQYCYCWWGCLFIRQKRHALLLDTPKASCCCCSLLLCCWVGGWCVLWRGKDGMILYCFRDDGGIGAKNPSSTVVIGSKGAVFVVVVVVVVSSSRKKTAMLLYFPSKS